LQSRLGQMHCPDCDVPVGTQSADEVIDAILDAAEGTKLYLMAPVDLATGQRYEDLWQTLRGNGYVRARVDIRRLNSTRCRQWIDGGNIRWR